MKVKKRTLLLIAGIVWMIAGINVFIIGIKAYLDGYVDVLNLILSIVTFLVFYLLIFGKMVKKHVTRISSFKEKYHSFIKFFDLKSFLIMAFMITLGVTVRSFNLAPESFIAFFYTGLSTALILAGIMFLYHFTQYNEAE